MRWPKTNKNKGYTIIEVMIVLAITGVLFSSAVILFQGQQAKTSLSQNMYDFASKLQSYQTEVTSGIYNGSKDFSCAISGGKAVLTSGGSADSGNQCLFEGRVLQFIPGSSDVYVYTVVGNRNIYIGASDSGKTAQSMEDTNPQVAAANGSMVLVDKYSFPGDLTFKSATVTSSDGSTLNGYGDLIGLYEDLGGSGAGTNLETIAYPFPQGSGDNTPYSPTLSACVSLGGNCASTSSGYDGSGYRRVSTWHVCIQNGSRQAEVKVKTSAQGLATEVDTQSCS